MKAVPSFFLLLFALFWCGFLGVFDSFAARGFVRQLRAIGFPTTTGQITRSEVTTSRGAKGKTNYRADISYGYVVDEHEWTGHHVTFGEGTFGDGRSQAQRLVSAFPPGKEVTVFYDPASPGDAVLRPGLRPEHLLIALFMTPHHMVGVALLLGALAPLWSKLRGPARESPLRPLDDLRMAVRMPWMSPLWIGIITLGATAFVAIFIVAFTLPLPLEMAQIAGVWAVILAFTGFMAGRQKKRIASGRADLLIDAGARTVTLPLGEGRKERMMIPFTDIHGVSVARRPRHTTHQTKSGWTVTTTNKQAIYELALIGPNESPLKLVNSADEGKLRGIAEALSKTFGWPLRTIG